MATIKVTDVIKNVSKQLADETNTRWTKAELLKFFNDSRRAIVSRRPDIFATNTPFPCVEDAKQTIPGDGVRFLSAISNQDGGGITAIGQDVLSLRIPNWQRSTTTTNVRHFVFNNADPKHFYLYPRPKKGHFINILYSRAPDDIAIQNFDTDTQKLGVDDVYSHAIEAYMLFRAWSKDAEYAGSATLARLHYASFERELGLNTQADTAASPNNA